jgi:hypothetical protein
MLLPPLAAPASKGVIQTPAPVEIANLSLEACQYNPFELFWGKSIEG